VCDWANNLCAERNERLLGWHDETWCYKFWEEYNPSKKVRNIMPCMVVSLEKVYVMHGEQVRLYLLGKYYLGVKPTAPVMQATCGGTES
jgi:hypothetical protein